jgi:phage tail sheath gpL-like
MSGAISFSQIPSNWRIPLLAIEFSTAGNGGGQAAQNTLLIGETALTTAPLTPQEAPSLAVVWDTYGPDSMIAAMYAQYLQGDPGGTVFTMGVPAATGTAASGTITVAGTASAAGTISLYVGGVLIPVVVNSGDLATAIATNIAAAINAAFGLPCAATVATDVVTLAANNPGVIWNDLPITLNWGGIGAGQQTPGGITLTLTPFAGGTGTVSLTDIDSLLLDQPYFAMVLGYNDTVSLAALTSEMNNTSGRWSPLRLLYGHTFAADQDSSANLLTLGGELNDPHMTLFGVTGSPQPPWVWAAGNAAAEIQSLRANPAEPCAGRPCPGLMAAPSSDRYTKAVEQSLLLAGISLSSYDGSGAVSILSDETTYKTNAYGQPSTAYLYPQTLYTLAAISQQLSSALTTKYGHSLLVPNGTPLGAGSSAVSPDSLKAEIGAQYLNMQAQELVINAAAMLASTVVQINPTNPNRADVLWTPYPAPGLREIAIKNQFVLASALAV